MRLTVETGPLAGTVVSLDRDHPTTIGSAPDCGLRIQEAGVLPQQAVVKALKDQGFGLKALGAGVRVNGASVEATPLHDGDVIEIGTTRIAFGQVQKRGLPAIAGYRILGELGKGGMGTVYRAEQTSLHREVALKVLSRELTKDPAFVAKFVAEARAAAKLQHPNVVQVFDVDNDGETYFYAMEVMHDGSLEGWLKRHGAMPVDRALSVVADAARGLAYAESLGMVHRDIKPDNLMLDQHGSVKIADLGLASTLEETEDKAMGTPHFMAPEQVLKKELDHRTDLYALGCTFYRLVTGKTPFRGQSVKDILRAQVKDDAEPANKTNPEVTAEVTAIIQKLMAKDPAQRFQTANALLEEIEVLQQPPAKKGLWIGIAAAGALVAGGAIYWAVTRDPQVITVAAPKYDDPEKQKFADDLVVLRAQQKQDRATIALLQARVSGLTGLELAAALERVASEHPDTDAAGSGRELAAQLRSRVEQDERAQQAQKQRRDDHLAGLRQALQVPRQSHDYAAATRLLDGPPPEGLAADAELATAVRGLRDEVTNAAREHLAALQARIAAARTNKDEEALKQAHAAFAQAIGSRNRWPAAMAAELDQAALDLATAATSLQQMAAARADAVWQQYDGLFGPDSALRPALARLDFAASAQAATAFGNSAADTPQGARARGVAAALSHAGLAAAALEAAAASGQLQLPGDDGPLTIARWDRAGEQFLLVDPHKKPAKEMPLPQARLTLEQWQGLCDGLAQAPVGSRECMLGFVALQQHQAAAAAFLNRITAGDDQSGTGAAGYPLRSSLFDLLLRRLPEGDTEPWAATLRDELRAGQRLAAGLRAVSERRNLAAAAHLDHLLQDHAHSFLVATLP